MNKLKLVALLMLTVLLTGILSAQDEGDAMPALEINGATVIAEGLNSPQGILVDTEGNIWIADSGLGGDEEIEFLGPGVTVPIMSPFGMTARIVMITPEGEVSDIVSLPSVIAGTDIIGVARLALLDDELYFTTGQWLGGLSSDRPDFMGVVAKLGEEGAETVSDLWLFEEANNPDGFAADSHPYGLAVGPDGWLWVADAGANTILKTNPETGDVELVAVMEGIPGVFPNMTRDNAIEADPVPTGIAFDDDGNAYVSLLSGVPFVPGSASVKMVDAQGNVSDYATNLTMLTDLRVAPDGVMYAVQFGIYTEEGPVPNSGAIVRIGKGETSEVIVDDLPYPTSIDFDAEGNAYITVNGVGAPGSGAVIRIDNLTGM